MQCVGQKVDHKLQVLTLEACDHPERDYSREIMCVLLIKQTVAQQFNVSYLEQVSTIVWFCFAAAA